jgi:transcriptional regulator with XRE-family HTH domain
MISNLTQERLSDLASIDRSFVQRIEAGTSSPTAEVLIRLKRAFGCSWEELFQGID